MAKTRAQRKAERRKRQAAQARQAEVQRDDESRAQQRTQVPESADVVEAELAEAGVDIDELKEAPSDRPEPEPEPEPPAEQFAGPAPSTADVGVPEAPDRISRRARRLEEKERKRRSRESELRRRQATEVKTERQRGAVSGFLASCWAELKRVQWPTRETLVQASAVTLLFIAVAAAYLGALDAVFNFLVKQIL